MLRLKNHNNVPPGNYFYRLLFRDGREEAWFGPCKSTANCRQFGPSPIINEVAQGLSNFRRANSLPRSSLPETIEDVDGYTCQRIGGMPAWCMDTDAPYSQVNPTAVQSAPCSTCGQKLNA